MLARALLLLTFSCGLSAVPEFSTLSDSAPLSPTSDTPIFLIRPIGDDAESGVLPLMRFAEPHAGIAMASESEVCCFTLALPERARWSDSFVLRLQLAMLAHLRDPRPPFQTTRVVWEIAGTHGPFLPRPSPQESVCIPSSQACGSSPWTRANLRIRTNSRLVKGLR
jgi:hypothetical protein